ncbi:MAG: ABC transporter permease [Dehalococcoidales bacterium]|jgi:lipopolysaccharide transport system permease protein
MTSQDILTSQNEWDLVIRPQRSWWDLRLYELWRYRDLIGLLVRRDFVAYYKQTILGPLWYLIQPLMTTVVFTVIFGGIAHMSTDGLPPFLFYMAGNTVWSYFAACLTNTSNTFTSNAAIFGKVYFPRLSIPVSVIISNLISFGIRLGVFLVFWVYFMLTGSAIHPNLWILLLPVLLVLMAGQGLGLGIIISSLTTKYRDLQQLVGFGVQLLMYATPVIYPLSTVQGIWRLLILANPMTAVVETFRLAFLGTSSLSPVSLLYSAGFMVVVFVIGVFIFNRVEATFMDTV